MADDVLKPGIHVTHSRIRTTAMSNDIIFCVVINPSPYARFGDERMV